MNQDTFDSIQEWHPIDDVQRTLFSRRDDLTAAEQRQYEQLNETSREIRRGLEPYKLTAQEREMAVKAVRKRYRKERRERSRKERFGDENASARDESENEIVLGDVARCVAVVWLFTRFVLDRALHR